METRPVAVEASGLALRTRQGPVYGPVDLTVASGDIVVLAGPAGSGKTALLLTIGGRMLPTAGSVRVMGADARRHPAAVRGRCGMAAFPGLNDLADALTVADTFRAECSLAGRAADARTIASLMRTVGLEAEPDTRVGELSALDRALLALALSLASGPAVVLVDDAASGLTPQEQVAFRDALRAVADRGVAVIASCTDPAALGVADAVVHMTRSAEGGVAHARS